MEHPHHCMHMATTIPSSQQHPACTRHALVVGQAAVVSVGAGVGRQGAALGHTHLRSMAPSSCQATSGMQVAFGDLTTCGDVVTQCMAHLQR
jgi:hypothetical protein